MIFEDRESTYPNRYLMTAEDGSAAHVILERADDPIKVGTPLNAETLNAAFNEKAPAVESADFPGCYYRTVNGEIEWLNPPMVVGVEYRTTQRYNGFPVYAKAIDLGVFPNNNTITVSHGIKYKIITSIEAYAYSTDSTIIQQLPLVNVQGTVTAKLHISANGVYIVTTADVSKYTGYVTIRYTKN